MPMWFMVSIVVLMVLIIACLVGGFLLVADMLDRIEVQGRLRNERREQQEPKRFMDKKE